MDITLIKTLLIAIAIIGSLMIPFAEHLCNVLNGIIDGLRREQKTRIIVERKYMDVTTGKEFRAAKSVGGYRLLIAEFILRF